MTRAAKLKMAIIWFGAAIVIYVAGYAEGTHDMMQAVNSFVK
jgi:hypothetical protein